jgi:hypothetical protein
MATFGIQQLTPAANALTSFSAVPAGKKWLWDINICNRNTATATIQLAVTLDGATSYYEYQTTLLSGGVLERAGRKAPAGATIKVLSSQASVDFILEYVEE